MPRRIAGPASVSGNCDYEILNRVAIEIGDVNVSAVNKECIGRQSDRRLLQECSVANAEKRVDPRLISGDSKVFDRVAVEVADGDARHSRSHFDLDRKLKRAVTKSQQNRNVACSGARTREARDSVRQNQRRAARRYQDQWPRSRVNPRAPY